MIAKLLMIQVFEFEFLNLSYKYTLDPICYIIFLSLDQNCPLPYSFVIKNPSREAIFCCYICRDDYCDKTPMDR